MEAVLTQHISRGHAYKITQVLMFFITEMYSVMLDMLGLSSVHMFFDKTGVTERQIFLCVAVQ